jgi:predicted O-methyltransferase YrrM
MDLGPWEKHRNELAPAWTLIRELQKAGQCGSPEPELLFCLSYNLRNLGDIVEIGTYVGTSLTALALAQKLSGHNRVIQAMDLRKQPSLDGNLEQAGVRHLTRLHVGDSADAATSWSRPLELLWIDGDHSYEGCVRDIRAWERHVMPGGFIAFHDFANGTGVPRAVADVLVARPHCYRVVADRPLNSSIFVVEKIGTTATAPWVDRQSAPRQGPTPLPASNLVLSALRKLRLLPLRGRRRG